MNVLTFEFELGDTVSMPDETKTDLPIENGFRFYSIVKLPFGAKISTFKGSKTQDFKLSRVLKLICSRIMNFLTYE